MEVNCWTGPPYLVTVPWDTHFIHMLTHHGTRWRGERLEERRQANFTEERQVDVLHGLLPGQTQQTVDGSSCEVYLQEDSPVCKA